MGRTKHGSPPRSKSEREFDHEIGNIVFVLLNAIDAGRLDQNPAAALGDEALGKRGEGCRASPLLRRGRTVQTLAKVYEDRAAEYSRAAQQIDAGQQEAKSKDAPTSLASTQP